MIRIEIDDLKARQAFDALLERATDLRPLMQRLGEHLIETTKQRFDTSTAPDGSRWDPNSPVTYERLTATFGKNNFHQKGAHAGRVNARGAARLAGKRPLVGETRALATTINYQAGSDYVEIGSPMVYAAVHQFGARKGSFTGGRTPWGDIPARPFLGISDDDADAIQEMVTEWLDLSPGPS